jgi:hypothetical protein
MTTTNVIQLKAKHSSHLGSCNGPPKFNQILIQRGMIMQYHDGRLEYTPGGKVMLVWNASRDPESPHRDAFMTLFDAADESGQMRGNDVYILSELDKDAISPAGEGWKSELLCTLFRLIAANLENAGYDIDQIEDRRAH